jgi:hypothetical protein
LAPTDLPHAEHILPHQLRQWGDQVGEILMTVDLHRSRGRFAEDWEQRLPGLRRLIADCCARYSHARTIDVSYDGDAKSSIERSFFRGEKIPAKDYRGGPFYSYFYALHAARFDRVLHFDSDMLFGGGSKTWLGEAMDILDARPDVLACNPLPGAPTSDGSLRSQLLEREAIDGVAYRSPALSTRLFLMDRQRLPRLQVERQTGRRSWGARLDGNPPFDTPEGIISAAMARSGLIRIDFLGRAPGMWSVHPPYRSATFYRKLPTLIQDVESDQVPEAQRGWHDIEDCMVDWSDVRPGRLDRIRTHLRLALDRQRDQLTAIRRANSRLPLR